MFRSTLVDKHLEFSAKEIEPATFLSELADEIRQELLKGTLREKKPSYEKIFLVKTIRY